MDWKKPFLAFFYADIRGFVQQFIGPAFGMPIDLVILLIGWWKSKEWWGETLVIAAATQLGFQKGQLFAGGLFGQGQTQQTQATQTPTPQQPTQQTQIPIPRRGINKIKLMYPNALG